MVSDAVLVAVMHRDSEFAPSTAQCLLSLLAYDAQTHGRVVRGEGPMLVPASPMKMVEVRNHIARTLVDDLPEVDWLLMLDADMGFSPTIADDLIAAADPVERPVVGALAFLMRKLGPDNFAGWHTRPEPTIFDYGVAPSGRAGFRSRRNYPPNALTQCSATGTAALLVHRSVFEKTRQGDAGGWFDRIKLQPDGDLIGEDMSFCAKLGAASIPVFVHTGVQTSHLRTVWITEADYIRSRAADTFLDRVDTDVSRETEITS